MMVVNGVLQYEIVAGEGTINDEGNPVSGNSVWSTPIPCLTETKKHENTGTYRDGEFTLESYEVYIDKQPFEAKRVKLTDCRGKEVGEFEVQDVQFLDLVQQVKITI